MTAVGGDLERGAFKRAVEVGQASGADRTGGSKERVEDGHNRPPGKSRHPGASDGEVAEEPDSPGNECAFKRSNHQDEFLVLEQIQEAVRHDQIKPLARVEAFEAADAKLDTVREAPAFETRRGSASHLLRDIDGDGQIDAAIAQQLGQKSPGSSAQHESTRDVGKPGKQGHLARMDAPAEGQVCHEVVDEREAIEAPRAPACRVTRCAQASRRGSAPRKKTESPHTR